MRCTRSYVDSYGARAEEMDVVMLSDGDRQVRRSAADRGSMFAITALPGSWLRVDYACR